MVKVFELCLSAPASRNFFYRVDHLENIQFWQILPHHHLLMVSHFWYFLGIFSLDTLLYRVYTVGTMRDREGPEGPRIWTFLVLFGP